MDQDMRAYLKTKWLGQFVHYSTLLDNEGVFFEMTLDQLAKDIARTAKRSGLTAASGDGDVFVQTPADSVSNPLRHAGTIGAKLHAEWSERPVDLLIFAVHAMLDAKENERFALARLERERRDYTALLKRLLAAKDMDEVRAAVTYEADDES